MRGITSEDRFCDAELLGGKNKPRVITILHPSDDTADYSSYKQIIISIPVIGPTRHTLHNFGSHRTTISATGQEVLQYVKRLGCGKVYWIERLPEDGGSPIFDCLSQQI